MWPPASSLLFPFPSTQGVGQAAPEGTSACGAAAGLLRVRVEVFCWSFPSQQKCEAPRKGEAIGCVFTAVLHSGSAKPGDCGAGLMAPGAISE